MTAADEPGGRGVVTALRRPPVRQSTLVRAGVRHTFDTFVATIGAWWPVRPFSAGAYSAGWATILSHLAGAVSAPAGS